MKVKITQTFTGYPDGKKPVEFKKGVDIEVADDFGKLIVGKGHATQVGPAVAPQIAAVKQG